ncbi:hypothetical protein AgCh_032277 [Apium graveolens]
MKGGLGFRDLYGFNIALLGKHCWNFINNPQSLVSRVYKERYFSNTTMLGAKKGQNPSFIWQGIMTAKTELQKGFRWIMGDGESINATKDPWLRLKADFCVENSHIYSGRDELVTAYIKQDTREWNIPLITEKFVSEDVQAILSVPIPQRRTRDRLVWSHSTTGAKEGYSGAPDFTVGMVLRDHRNTFLVGCTSCFRALVSVFEAEVIGVREALSWVKDMQFNACKVELETDSLLVVQGIKNSVINLLEVGEVLEQCRRYLRELEGISIHFVRNQANRVAHELLLLEYPV